MRTRRGAHAAPADTEPVLRPEAVTPWHFQGKESRRHLGDYSTSTVNEAAAMGAAFFAGIAAGILERPGPEDPPRCA